MFRKIVQSAITRYHKFKDCSFMIPININIDDAFIYSVNYDYTHTLPLLVINVEEDKDLFSFIFIIPESFPFEEAKRKAELLFLEIDNQKQNIPTNVIQFAIEKHNLVPYNGILSPLPEWVIHHQEAKTYFGNIFINVEMKIYIQSNVTTVKHFSFEINTTHSVQDFLLLIKQSSDFFESYEVTRLYNVLRDFHKDEKIYEIAIQELQIYCDIILKY